MPARPANILTCFFGDSSISFVVVVVVVVHARAIGMHVHGIR